VSDETPVKVVGMGPFPLPGEKKRRKRAEEDARRLLDLAEAVQQRTTESGTDEQRSVDQRPRHSGMRGFVLSGGLRFWREHP
jgi:hypothetical protein